MTGKVIGGNATGILILILPIAFLIVLLFKIWPVLLALFILSISVQVWQQYQWKQWSKQVNPYFNQLIKENQGCLTALDLSMKASLTAGAAQQYLEKKAEEFGAQRRDYEDKGTVYYFLTASALESIFDESEPPLELEEDASPRLAPNVPELPTPILTPPSDDASRELPEPPENESDLPPDQISSSDVESDAAPLEPDKPEQDKAFNTNEDLWGTPEQQEQMSHTLIQAELAKRLDVHSSTVGKRKSDPDFAEWSQSRDPDGIAWEYSPETKEFMPLNLPKTE